MTSETAKPELTAGGLTKADIEKVIAKRGYIQFWLGEYASDRPSYEQRRFEAVEQANAVLQLYNVPEGWRTGAEATLKINELPEEIPDDLTLTAGHIITEAGERSLALESDEDGYADASLAIQVGSRVITLVANGDFWTERTYKHRKTGQVLCSGELENNTMTDLNGDDNWLCDSEVAYQLQIECMIENPVSEL
jgi:hypothetical protein